MGFQWVTGISFEVTLDFCIITKVLLNSSHKNKMSMVTYIVNIKKKIQNKQNNIINSYKQIHLSDRKKFVVLRM